MENLLSSGVNQVRKIFRANTMAEFGSTEGVLYEVLEQQLKENGTNIDLNRRSPLDNGDQSEIRDDKRADFHRMLWSYGGNGDPFCGPQLSEEALQFSQAVLTGSLEWVEKYLVQHGKQFKVRLQNIESDQSLNGRIGTRGKLIAERNRYVITLEPAPEEKTLREISLKPASFTIIEEIPPRDPTKLRELLEHRWGVLRTPPLIMCIMGAKTVVNPTGRWKDIGVLLIEHGANVDDKDLVGKTVVHYGCGGMLRTPHSDVIVKACCKKMPSLVDTRDRMGEVALQGAVMVGDIENVQLMTETLKADPLIPDFHGVTPMSMCRYDPKVSRIISSAASKIKGKAMKQAVKASCDSSGCSKPGTKKCTRCLSVYYCSKECQVAAWKSHKGKCNQILTDVIEVRKLTSGNYKHMRGFNGQNFNGWNGKPPGSKQLNEEFIVKIQYTPGTFPCLCYDKKRLMCLVFDKTTCPRYDELCHVIATKGPLGRKAYFRARVSRKGVLEVFHKALMPSEAW